MSESAETTRWKEKYSRLLDDYERLERHGQQQIELLQRGLVRSSLAAEGQDAKLDTLLESLRNLIRQPDNQVPLQQLIADIERHILNSDQHKQARQSTQLEALDNLVTQLLNCQPDSATRKALKKLQKSLKDSQTLGYNLHLWLQQLSELQGSALQQLSTDDSRPAGGLFGRLLGRNSPDTAVAEHSAPAAATPDDSDESAETETETETETLASVQPQQPSGTQRSPVTEHSQAPLHSGRSPAATHDGPISADVQKALLKLLQELAVSSPGAELSSLEAKIHTGIHWPELAPTLNLLADSIVQASTQRQQEFGSYLQQLNAKLSEISGSVQQTRSGYESAMQAADRFDEQLQTQVSDIHQDVRDTQDLSELKQRVDQRLNLFVESLRHYQDERKESEQSLLQRLYQLNERVHLVETEAAQLTSKLVEQHEKARQDALTGLPNRMAWDERLGIEHERISRVDDPLLLAVVDIDHFKRINDNYGHLAGDKVLKILAGNLQKGIRKTDFIARFGGEEFVILLPNTPLEQGAVLLNKLREKIAGCPFHFKGEPVQITFSAGVGRLSADETASQAFARIDEALYQAKQNGRNRVQTA